MNEIERERRYLHESVALNEPIEIDDLKRVNTFSRMELMKEKTRELTRALINHQPSDVLYEMLETFNHLAVDWVYSDVLLWEDSLAAKQVQSIKDFVRNRGL
jgi:hypothetical protein